MELRKCTSCGTIAAQGDAIRCAKCDGRLELGDEHELIGRRFGSYTLVEVLGAGGMGVVFRASHETLGRDAAVKLLLPGRSDAQAHRRFINEARLLAGLRHRNVVTVYDFAETDWGAPYLVLERLSGRSAESLLEAASVRRESGLPPAVVSAILAGAVEGLTAAHAAGIVHRDLKPSNLFVAVEDGNAVIKVIDFGIAQRDAGDPEATRLTASAAVVGTPLYLAPEQLRGETAGPACDQYALALTACELLSGAAVREGMTLVHILRFEIADSVPVAERFPGLAEATARALERATEPDPARRHPDLAAFLAALALPPPEHGARELLERATASPESAGVEALAPTTSGTVRAEPARPITPPDPAPGPPSPRRFGGWRAVRFPALAVLTALAVGGLATFAVLRSWRPPPAAAAAEPAPSPAAVPAAPALVAPADARSILVETGNAWVVASVDAWTLLPKGGEPSTRIGWPDGATILGAAASGELWMRRGDRLLAIDPASRHEREIGGPWPAPWASAPPAELAVAPRGGYVALDRGDAIAVAALGERGLEPHFEVRVRPGRIRFALGDEHLVVAESEGSLTLHRLADGAELWRRPLPEHSLSAFAYGDGLPWLALGSSVGEVRVIAVADGREVARWPRAGTVRSLRWIPDRPTLAIGHERGLTLWRPGESAEPESLQLAEEFGCAHLLLGSTALGCLDDRGVRLVPIAYGTSPERLRVELGRHEAWAAVADPAGSGALYVGTADGVLHRYDLGTGAHVSRRVHDAGVTALALAGDRLASASDDRTLAVWKLPALELEFRTRAHGYLINALDFEAGSLWSASSDRKVKRWSWPALEELDSVEVDRASGMPAELHALDVDRGGDRIWLGTWSRFALRLDRAGAGFRAERFPLAGRSGYRWQELPALEARVLLGIDPAELIVFDDRTGEFQRLPTYDRPLYALAPAGGSSFWATGAATILRFDLVRREGGGFDWTVRATVASGLGETTAAAAVGETLGLADVHGSLRLVDAAALAAAPPLARRADVTPE